MKLDENYKLEGEKYNWVLSYESEVKTNDKGLEYTSKDQWYFSNIQNAIKKYCDESSKQSESIEELKQILENLNTTIEKLKNKLIEVL